MNTFIQNIIANPQTTALGLLTGVATFLAQFGIIIPDSYKTTVTVIAGIVASVLMVIHANDPKKA